jgi:hypothetical protein
MNDTLRYHQAVFTLLRRQPQVSAERLERLRQLEQRAGVPLPASIVEWFSIEGAGEIFERNTAPDWLTDLDELTRPEAARQGYLHVASESQGVVEWYARLTGADDPPVYDNNDESSQDLSRIRWHLCAPTFSRFVFHRIAATHNAFGPRKLRLSAEEPLPDEPVLEALRRDYSVDPPPHSPDSVVHRLYSENGRVTVEGVRSTGRAHWVVSAPRPEALDAVVRSLWPHGTLASTLSPKSTDPEARAQEEAVLARHRAG